MRSWSTATTGRWARLGAMLCLALTACGPDAASGSADSDSGGAASGDATTEGAIAWPPTDCTLDESPFVESDCLAGLRTSCNAAQTETDCAAVDPLGFDDGSYQVACGWAKVVTFSDAQTCTVDRVFGRCEPVLATECGDFCAGEDMLSDVSAIPSRREIVELCGGPLGPWSAVGTTDDSVSTCADNVSPPSDPLCACAPVACDAG